MGSAAMHGGYGRAARRALALAAALIAPAPALAEVFEIAPDGRVEVLQGPAVHLATRTAFGARRGRRAAPPAAAPRALLGRAALETELSPALLAAVAWRESAFRQEARSPKGAVGVMQLTPATARDLGVDPANAAENVSGGARYLKALLARYDGDLVRALEAYNAGPGRADRWGGGPPTLAETRSYVAAILERLSQEAEGRVSSMEGAKP